MATIRQIEANRRNAMKSIGPRSVEGKAASRFNAFKTGIDAQSTVIPGEDPARSRRTRRRVSRAFPPGDARPPLPGRYPGQRRVAAPPLAASRGPSLAVRMGRDSVGRRLPLARPGLRPFHGPFLTRLQRRMDATERVYRRALEKLERLGAAPLDVELLPAGRSRSVAGICLSPPAIVPRRVRRAPCVRAASPNPQTRNWVRSPRRKIGAAAPTFTAGSKPRSPRVVRKRRVPPSSSLNFARRALIMGQSKSTREGLMIRAAEVHNEFAKAWNARDFNEIRNLYHKDYVYHRQRRKAAARRTGGRVDHRPHVCRRLSGRHARSQTPSSRRATRRLPR